jgi:hypothetical protein
MLGVGGVDDGVASLSSQLLGDGRGWTRRMMTDILDIEYV